MTDAMRLVRQTLGEDAVIVSSQDGPAGGVQVMAAVEHADERPLPEPVSPPQMVRGLARDLRDPPPAIPAIVDRPPPPRAVADATARDGALSAGVAALFGQGVPAALSQTIGLAIARSGQGDTRAALHAAVAREFRFDPLPQDAGHAPIMLVGPPGAGKTLAIAKLAAAAVIGGLKPAVVTCDAIRAGGVEQLAAFTRILKIPLLSADDPLTLADALMTLKRSDIVFVDSAGRNPFDPADLAELDALLDAAAIEPVLTLPAGGDPVEAAEITRIFRIRGCRRLVVTRADTTRRIGAALAAAHAGLAFANWAASPRVADGLPPLTAEALTGLLLGSPAASLARPQRRQAGAS